MTGGLGMIRNNILVSSLTLRHWDLSVYFSCYTCLLACSQTLGSLMAAVSHRCRFNIDTWLVEENTTHSDFSYISDTVPDGGCSLWYDALFPTANTYHKKTNTNDAFLPLTSFDCLSTVWFFFYFCALAGFPVYKQLRVCALYLFIR